MTDMFYYIYRIDLLDGTGRYYIGQRSSTVSPEKDTRYRGSGKILCRFFEKNGGYYKVQEGVHYTKTILEECESYEDLNKAEIRWIGNLYEVDPLCMNLKGGGDGRGWSEESKKKSSLSHIGKYPSKETREKLSKAHTGVPKPKDKEWREKIAATLRGTHQSKETREKRSKSLKGKNVGPKSKYMWKTPSGEEVIGYPHLVARYHLDWVKVRKYIDEAES